MQAPVFRHNEIVSDEHQRLTNCEVNGLQKEDDNQTLNQYNVGNEQTTYSNKHHKDQPHQQNYLFKILLLVLIAFGTIYVLDINSNVQVSEQKNSNNQLSKTQILIQNTNIDSLFSHNQNIKPSQALNTQKQLTIPQQLANDQQSQIINQSKLPQKQKDPQTKINIRAVQSDSNPQQSPKDDQQTVQIALNYQQKSSINSAQKSVTNKEDEDEFELNFVQTQFEGKQTQQSLAAAAFAKMENQINSLKKIQQSNFQTLLQRKKMLEDISTLQVMIPDSPKQNNYVAENFYYFSVSIQQMILNSDLQKMYQNGQTIFKISLKQHMRAIIRTQLVHNVNFKGEIEVNLSPFDKGQKQKRKAIQQIMEDEQIYYESLYELSKYNKNQLRFCLVIPSYNNVKSKLYLRNLDSIFMQDYSNYHVVYVDDASPDHTGDFVQKYIAQKKIPSQKIKVIINKQNKKALFNIYNTIHAHCPNGQIVGLIDGDDSLLGRKVLQLYNAVYQSKKTAIVYSNFLKILTNNKTSFGFGTQLSKSQFRDGKLRNDMSLVGTHFMTFFSDIFKKIRKEDLCYESGQFYDYAYDRAIISPLIEMAYPRVEYIPEITYEYRNDTGINDGTQDWERVSKIIMKQKPYQMLKQFAFIDDFVEQLIPKNHNSQHQTRSGLNQNVNSQNSKQAHHSFFKQDDEEEEDQKQG